MVRKKINRNAPTIQHNSLSRPLILSSITALIAAGIYYLNFGNSTTTTLISPAQSVEPLSPSPLAAIFTPVPSAYESILKQLELTPLELALKTIKEQSAFMEWAQKIKIQIDDKIKSPDTEINIEKAKLKIALNEITTEKSFLPFIFDATLRIALLSPENAHSSASFGLLSHKENIIWVVYRPYVNIANYKKALLNELSSQQITLQNKLNQVQLKSLEDAGLPFLTKTGDIDQQAYENFDIAIKSVKTFCNDLLVQMQNNTISSKLNTLIELSKSYEPRQYSFPPSYFKQAVEIGVIEKTSDNTYIAGPRYPQGTPKFLGHEQNGTLVYTHDLGNTTESKTLALLVDLKDAFEALDNPKGPYASMSQERKLAETISFIAELPAPIQKFLAEDYYKLMLDFFTKNKNANLKPDYLPKKSKEPKETKKPTYNSFSYSQTKSPTIFPSVKNNQKKQQSIEPTKQAHTTRQVNHMNQGMGGR